MKQPPTPTRRPVLTGGAPAVVSDADPKKIHSVSTVLGGTVVHDTGAVHQERGRPCADV